MPRRPGRSMLITATFLATLVAIPLATSVPAAIGATPPPCKVTNLTRGGTKGTLQKAVNAARKGDVLSVTGMCKGTTRIAKNLTIRGKRTQATGVPTLNGQRAGSVVTIDVAATVTMVGLTIRNGAALGEDWPFQSGGGIFNAGTLTLRRVVVKDNRARVSGGGIRAQGDLTLVGSWVKGNRITEAGGDGCGIATEATVTLKGTTTVSNNTPLSGASCDGAGIAGYLSATLLLQDTAYVTGNKAGDATGGGLFVDNDATAILSDGAWIHQNVADRQGGGAFVEGVLTIQDTAWLSENSASDGGGIYGACGTVTIPDPQDEHVISNAPNEVSVIC